MWKGLIAGGGRGDGIAEGFAAEVIVHCALEDKALDANRQDGDAAVLDTIVSCRSLKVSLGYHLME